MKIKVPLFQWFKSKLLTLTLTESPSVISEELRDGGQVHLSQSGREWERWWFPTGESWCCYQITIIIQLTLTEHLHPSHSSKGNPLNSSITSTSFMSKLAYGGVKWLAQSHIAGKIGQGLKHKQFSLQPIPGSNTLSPEKEFKDKGKTCLLYFAF